MPAAPSGAEAAYGSPEGFAAWTAELLELESKAEGEESIELLTTCTHSELQARGIAVLKLCVAEQTTALYGRACLTLEKPGGQPLPVHRITHGDIVGIFDQGTRPLSKAAPIASAVVQRIRPNGISLALEGDVPAEVLDGRQLNIAAISSEVTIKRYREALDMLMSGRPDGPAASLVSVCFSGDQKPRFHEVKTEESCRPDAVDCTFRARQSQDLNEPQQAAVVKALRAVDISVIHGPPGTGKTTTVVAYILEAVYRKQRLLVTAPSNVAVDNLLERVVACGCRSVVRLGHPARVQTDMHKFTMENILYASEQAALCRDIKKEIDDALKRTSGHGLKAKEARVSAAELTALRKELRQRERRAVAEVLQKVQVVFATCTGAATLHREIRKGASIGGGDAVAANLSFDTVIIDEAAQALEVSCWIPMLLGRKAVLAGDHQQLAATVKSSVAQKRGLDRTLFARMIDRYGDDVASLLSIQYRMNSVIMGWSSRCFYGARLEAAESVACRVLNLTESPADNLVAETLESMRTPLLFVDTGGLVMYRETGQEDASGGSNHVQAGQMLVQQSRGNPGESRFVVHYAKMLVKCGVNPKDITIITPYNRQVECLRSDFTQDAECGKLGLEKPRVNTVDSFQGQEADAVLISLVRSNERGVVGFLADYRRLNVAVTRARRHVMLVGDAATITTDSMLASLYDYACEQGRVAFVQQLLDEEGEVPPDPSTVVQPGQNPKLLHHLGHKKEKASAGGKDEQEVRRRFEKQFNALAERGGGIELPSTLNPFERAVAHEVATELGLQHESKGEGMARRLYVWTTGPELAAGAEDAGLARAASASKEERKEEEGGSAAQQGDAEADADSGAEQETALEAFERRAAAQMRQLAPGSAAVEWKSPTECQQEILQRLAQDNGLELLVVGNGKKRRCRVERAAGAQVEGGEAVAGARAQAQASQLAPSTALLNELHAERDRRREQAAAERREHNESIKAELKQAKKAGKQKQACRTAADPDDLDALLEEFSSKDGICAFGTCKEKTHTLIDPVSRCRYCEKRFCMQHVKAELHGCGDLAQRVEQKKFRQAYQDVQSARGSGLVGKSCGDNRGQLANKLQDKIQKQEASRNTKRKEKK